MNTSRQLIYGIMITVAVGSALGRVLSTQLVFEPSLYRDEKNPDDRRTRLWPKVRPAQMPTYSSNDRSRWATIRALVDEGTYVIGQRDPETGHDSGIIFEDGWQSLDKVLQPTKLEFYSSKPPLLSTLLAGLYWLLQTLFGWTLIANPNAVVRTTLVLVNVLPFLIYLKQIARLAEDFGRTDWGRIFVVGSAAFGTLATPFLVTLNNHTIATYCVLFALVSVVEVWRRAPHERGGLAEQGITSPWQYHAAAGFFASFAVCNELPALSFAVAVFLLILFWAPRQASLFFLGAAALPAAGFLVTNYLAIGQLRPAYSEFGGPWYEYEGSYWRKPLPGQVRSGIDWAYTQESRGTYIFHLLVGHHGLFSLTPLWLLAVFPMLGGLIQLKRNWNSAGKQDVDQGLPWFIAPLALGLTVVVVSFYALMSDNYGGFTLGLRWLMWLSPLWLLCLLPCADWLGASRWGRGLGYLCLGLSVLSVNYSPWNPWRHPWLYDLFVSLGWPGY